MINSVIPCNSDDHLYDHLIFLPQFIWIYFHLLRSTLGECVLMLLSGDPFCRSSFVYLFSAILNYVIYCASRSCVRWWLVVRCISCCEGDEQRRKGFSKRIKATLRFSTAIKIWEMTAFYHMASEFKPGRGLTTKLTTDILGRLSCLRTPSISSVWIQQSSLWLMPTRFCSLLLLFSAI